MLKETIENSIMKMTMSRKITIPVDDDFKTLVTKSDIFVDKSLLIQEIIDSDEGAILITRPRRWGKSLNMSMIQRFLEIEVNKRDGSSLHYDQKVNNILFEGGTINLGFDEIKELQPLKITQYEHIMKRQGKFPVIFVSFKDAIGNSSKDVELKLKDIICNLYRNHRYLSNSNYLADDEKKKFQKYLDEDMEIVAIQNSLKFLSELLEKHFEQKVYILVDEYDRPVNHIIEKYMDRKDDELHQFLIDTAELITNILSACGKGNKCLEKLILTGIFDTLKREECSGLDNIKIYGIADVGFYKNYGFSREEIKTQLLDQLDFSEEQSNIIIKNLETWYGGYNITIPYGDTLEFFTPWSVINYLKDILALESITKPESYWSRSSTNAILGRKIQNGEDKDLINRVILLSQGKELKLKFDKNTSLLEYSPIDYINTEKVLAYLLVNSGYLTVVSPDFQSDYCLLKIPNSEVQKVFMDSVKSQLEIYSQFNIDSKFTEFLIKADQDKFRKELKSYIYTCFNSVDTFPRVYTNRLPLEQSYKMFFLGLLYRLNKTHLIKSKDNAVEERLNIFIASKAIDKSINEYARGVSFIIELKRGRDETKLDRLVKQGMDQIKTLKYWQKLDELDSLRSLNERGYKVFISAAFAGREVRIAMEKQEEYDQNTEWAYVQKANQPAPSTPQGSLKRNHEYSDDDPLSRKHAKHSDDSCASTKDDAMSRE